MCYILWWRTYKPLKQKFPFCPDLIYLSKNFQTINRLIDSSKKVVFISSGINFRSRVLDMHSTVGAWQKKKNVLFMKKKNQSAISLSIWNCNCPEIKSKN